MDKESGWELVVFADELPDCEDCGEKWCPKHGAHYADCPCIGPTQDDVVYKEVKGRLYARPRKKRWTKVVPGLSTSVRGPASRKIS